MNQKLNLLAITMICFMANRSFAQAPTVAATTPTVAAANVISLFSGAYTDRAGTDWFPNWGQSTVVTEVMIAGNATKKYTTFNYQGVALTGTVNVTTMTHLHLDLWTPDCTSFKVSLISAGPVEQAVTLTPTLSGWNSFDIPLSSYTTPNKAAIFQLKLEGTPSGSTVYLDNIYFANTPTTAPTTAAPTPTALAANVMSLFSGAYTDIAGTDWFPNWGQSTVVTEVAIAGNATKKYTNFNYQGVALASAINVTTMTHLHLDLWTPDCTSFKVSLISAGPVEQAVTLTPTLAGWNSFDIALTSYTTPNKAAIIQLKLEGTPTGSTAFLDNIYFYKAPAVVPVVAAPTPTALAADVMSLFSGAYTDIAGTDWFPNWGQSTVVTEVLIAGNATKKYANLNYQGVALTGTINVTTMTHLHLDLWTPDCTSFKVSLISAGPVEQAVTLTPTLSGWNSFDIPLSSYTTPNKAAIFQLKLEGTPSGSTVFLDNIYFYKTVAVATAPVVAAPTPTALAANVMSLFSGAYTDIAGTDWFPNWGQSTVVTEVMVAGNATKKYTNLNYQGVTLASAMNVSTMNFLHLDLWTPDCTSFKVSLISAGPVEQAVTLTPTLAGWNSFDIPLTSYTTPNKTAIIQLKLEGTPSGSTVYLDNIYFYKTPAADPSQAIFTDAYATGVTFEAFGGSVNDVTVDNTTFQSGTSSLKVVVGATGYTGGALVAATNQNLAAYNAVSFWVKASAAKTLNVAGLGNNAATTVYQAEMMNIPVTTTWAKVIIPIPVPAKLSAEKGLFHFAEGGDEGAYTIWFDNIQYENISGGVIGTPTATMTTETINKAIGDAFSPNGLTCSFPVNGVAKAVVPSKAYFTYTSSTPAVATISTLGVGTTLTAGTTNITAMLGAVAVTGTLTVNVAAVAGPLTAAPTPTRPANSVMSLFSNAYTDIANTDWFPNWGQTTVVTEVLIATNPTKKYSNFNYQGVQFATPLNVTAMNYLHIDMWTPNCTSFKVSLINIPPLTQTEQAVTLTPTLSGWNSFDIPLTSYNLINKTGIGQLKLEGTPAGSVAYLDNLFFFKTGVGTNDLTLSKDLFTANPTLADDFVRITLNDKVQGNTQITLSTLTGQKVYEENLNINYSKMSTIPTQNLPAGMYIIGVRTGTNYQSQKIVVSH